MPIFLFAYSLTPDKPSAPSQRKCGFRFRDLSLLRRIFVNTSYLDAERHEEVRKPSAQATVKRFGVSESDSTNVVARPPYKQA